MSADADTVANANIAAASLQADASRASAEASAAAQTGSATISSTAQIKIAEIDAANRVQVEILDTANRLAVAKVQSGNQVEVAQVGLAGTLGAADRSRDAAIETANIDAANRLATTTATVNGSISTANIDAQNRVQVAEITTTASLNQTITESQARIQAATIDSEAQHYSADQQLASTLQHESGENNRLQTKLNYADAKFNIALGLAQQGLAIVAGQGGASGTPGLLALETAPYISTRGVFTPAQVQQQVNGAYARNDSRTNNQIRQAQGDLAGRGFSSNSPLLDALKVGYVGQNLRANAEAATAVRIQSATANADQVTKGQTLAVSEWQAKQQVALDSEKNAITRQVGILGAVAQMVNVG